MSGHVALLGLKAREAADFQPPATELDCSLFDPTALPDDPTWVDNIDAVVIGEHLRDPVPLLTVLGSRDANLPVFVLRSADTRQALVNRLRFAPGIGRHIRIWDHDSIDSLLLELAAAAHRKTSQEALSRGLSAASQHGAPVQDGYVLDDVLNHAPVGIVVVDPDARILAVNREGEKLLGWSQGNARGHSLISRFDVGQREALSTLVADSFAGQASTVPLAFSLRRVGGGAQRDLHLSIGRVGRSGSVQACAAYLDDVTELVQSKRDLENARDQLEHRIAARTKALSDVKKRLEQRTRDLEASNIELERAKAELEQLSVKDALTGVFNRRYMATQLGAECRRLRRSGGALSLMMVDIDHFKAYNDSLGHPEGDRCLVRVADLFHAACRRTGEFVVRYGGEEFLAVLPGCDAHQAATLAAACLQAVQDAAMPHPTAGQVSVSIGVLTAQGDELADPDALLSRADTALYHAKAAGRNRVELADA